MPLIRDTPPGELSPYLEQHRDNPVDWYPWGEEAFARAAAEDKPIFLSVGYSACHWCHVMAHESFEDPVVAARLNASFVCIKVDREERPDVDAVYMEAVQSMTGSGGWPMSVFLTPDRRPFYGGTYFPPRDLPGRPVVHHRARRPDRRLAQPPRTEVEEQADELAGAIAARSVIESRPGAPSLLDGTGGEVPDLVAPAVDRAGRAVRPRVGRLRRRTQVPPAVAGRPGPAPGAAGPGAPTPGRTAEAMAVRTLDAMAAGGIHDHLGGGFARYATDTEWLVPHFEKMLYDQAGLLRAYLHGWQVTGDPRYREVMDGIVAYVSRDLTGARGRGPLGRGRRLRRGRGQVLRLDARPGGRGRRPTAGPRWRTPSSTGSTSPRPGNFEGSTILRRPVGRAARRARLPSRTGGAGCWRPGRRRVRPGLDDKVLTEWNAMYGSALAEAAAATGSTAWATAAVGIGEFLVHPPGRRPGTLAAELAARRRRPPPRLCRRPRLAGRLLHPPGRAHR